MKNKKYMVGILSCAIISGAFLGYNNSKVSGDEITPEVKQLAEAGSKPEVALKAIPDKVEKEFKLPEKLPFNEKQSESAAIAKEFGDDTYYYEQYWEKDGKYFFFNVINETPEIDNEFKEDPNFTYETVKIYNGIYATYLKGPTSEKLYWNDNGFQYMIGSNSPDGSTDFYGPEKLEETANSLKVN
ncbi:hypothetical protein DFO70_12548 [Cytobacillus firmus]|uniref:DUF4367 domain-containing protein n=2 Tax=Cytobacillus TaxID=2675230 RepID=A0A366JL17_CYTFI|nr:MULTISPECIES: hypothetical protein [Cytobacillus]RBP86580.1 hypothetical protein DFO70_12548 [Cytobacillus firmus]TDX39321.1 hypothetical protein DFO72_111152 [Cytobacillus oceanisediminis]